MQLAPTTSSPSPALAAATRFQDHFTALGVDAVEPTGTNELTLHFDAKSGLEYVIANAAIKDALNGVQLVLDLADGAPVPRMLPGASHVSAAIQKLPGVDKVTVAETFPSQVTVFADGRASASALSTLLATKLPDGSSVGVSLANVAPNE